MTWDPELVAVGTMVKIPYLPYDIILPITRLTKTQAILGKDEYRVERATGRVRGGGRLTLGRHATFATPHDIEETSRVELVRRLQRYPWKALNFTDLTKIAAILWPDDTHVL